MKWFVLCFIVVNVSTKCEGNKFEEFLWVKEDFLQKVDERFESLVDRSMDEGFDDGESSEQPMTLSGFNDDDDGSPDVHGSEENDLEGSGVSTTHAPRKMTPLCRGRIKNNVMLCQERSLNLHRLLVEMGRLVIHTGYYDVSLGDTYRSHVFRACMKTVPTPDDCPADAVADIDAQVFRRGVADTHYGWDSVCLATQLGYLNHCLDLSEADGWLEGLVKVVMLGDQGVSREVCGRFEDVRECFITSMAMCENNISYVLVNEMFEVTLNRLTCVEVSNTDSGGDVGTSMGTIVLFALAVLTAKLL